LMAADNALVSVVVIFFNEKLYLGEAVASVQAQTYPHWELLLVDDGSTDGSTELAKEFARQGPARIRYVEHPGHSNRGASATRNLGVAEARGEWIAFLDGDDIWLPMRLERSVDLARANPDADMVYGKTEYWYSWQGASAREKDRVQPHFFAADRLVKAPDLLVRHLSLRAALPCMGSLLIRRNAYLNVGGFEKAFRGLVDDAVFLGKFCLHYDVYVSNECWDRYRQHPGSDTAVAAAEGRMQRAQLDYLHWLQNYSQAHAIDQPSLHKALRGAIRRVSTPSNTFGSRLSGACRRLARWVASA
jgi:glycosyltransferase involved in cell wall biosynthesis